MIFLKLTLGYILDLLFGDPEWLYHPVRLIGKGITGAEKVTRKIFAKTKKGEFLAGLVTVILVVGLSYLIPAGILYLCRQWSKPFAFVLETFWIYQILAGKCLATEARQVGIVLKEKGLVAARRQLSRLVGRETKNLTRDEVIRASVETVSENTTDGEIAPLLFIALGGAPLGFAYKAVNTLDSMIGYRTEKYEMFGKVAARLDDVVNFIPARVAALLMIVSAWLCGYDAQAAAHVFAKDRYKHESPNSAQTESVCAGALGILLGGTHIYFGRPVYKPTIGQDLHRPKIGNIEDACILLGMTSFLMVFLLDLLRFVWWLY